MDWKEGRTDFGEDPPSQPPMLVVVKQEDEEELSPGALEAWMERALRTTLGYYALYLLELDAEDLIREAWQQHNAGEIARLSEVLKSLREDDRVYA